MMKKKGFWYLILGVAIAMMAIGQCGAATPAGTTINAASRCAYANSAGVAMPTVSSNTVGVTVTASSSTASLALTADATARTVAPGVAATYYVYVQNLGSATDTFTFKFSTPSSGWQTGIWIDANGNGQIDSGELRPTWTSPALGPNGTFSCTVGLVPPAGGTNGTCVVSVTSAADPTVTKSISLTAAVQGAVSPYIRQWLAVGPFAANSTAPVTTDYLGREANAVPGLTVAGKDWAALNSTTDTVDFGTIYNGAQNSVAYAGVYIKSDVAQQAVLSYTSTGGGQVWLNGAAVYTEPTAPADPTQPRQAPIQLFAGWNRLVLKLAQTTGPWNFSAVIDDAAGKPLTNVQPSTTRASQTPVTISNVQVSGIDAYNGTIQWTTDAPTSSIVNYSSATTANLTYSDAALVLQHTVKLTNLQPSTNYVFTPSGLDTFGYSVKGTSSSIQTAAVAAPTWVTNWLINGTYPKVWAYTFLQYPYIYSEGSIAPYEGLYSNGRRWMSSAVNNYGVLNFQSYYPNAFNCCGYAHVYVYSPTMQPALLFTGSNDGIKAYLNGRLVLYKDVTRPLVVDQDRTPVTLLAGWNRLLVKVSQYSDLWQLCARFTTPTGAPVNGMQFRINRP